MELTITYDNLKITCKCEKYGKFFEVEEMDCPDHDSTVSEFVCDRYEKDQQFAMCIQDKLHTAYREDSCPVCALERELREAKREADRMGRDNDRLCDKVFELEHGKQAVGR